MATRSMPIVSCLSASKASFSFVPTPSVPATRYESPARAAARWGRAARHACRAYQVAAAAALAQTVVLYRCADPMTLLCNALELMLYVTGMDAHVTGMPLTVMRLLSWRTEWKHPTEAPDLRIQLLDPLY